MKDQKRWRNGTLVYTFSGLITLFLLLLLGDFSWSLKERSIIQIVQLLIKEYGASDTLSAILTMSMPAALGMVLTPIICYRSDRCRSRWGRRIPYLTLMTPVASVAIIGMAYSPVLGKFLAQSGICSTPERGVLWMMGVCWTVFEFSSVMAGALFTALVNDVVPHEVMGRFYGLFRCISLGSGIVFNWWFLGFASTHPQYLFLGVCIIYTLGFMIMCLFVKEGEYPAPEPASGGKLAATVEYMKLSFSNPYYCLVLGFYAMAIIAMSPVSSFAVLYATHMHISMDTYGKAIAATFGLSLVLSYPMGMLADRIHPLRVGVIMIFVYGVVALSGYFFVIGPKTFLTFFVISVGIAGCYFNGAASLLPKLLPQKDFGSMSSAGEIIRSLGTMVGLPVLGVMLDYTGHKYIYLFLVAGIGCFLTGGMGILLYREFKKHGGPNNYQAP
ncbi:MAG: MFS transporter [Victivallales bacterium]|nr:MFS transporter [Victivallales bacterium]